LPPIDDTVTRFTNRAAVGAERTMSWVRAVFLTLVLARIVAIGGPEILAGETKHLVAIGGVFAGYLATAALFLGVGRARDASPWLVASPMVDAAIAFVVMAPSVIAPRPEYLGLLRAPDLGVWPLVVAASGLRLSRSAAWAGALSGSAWLALLVAIDVRLNAPATYAFGPAAMVVVLMMGASLLAIRLASWVRGLVAEAAAEASRAERHRAQLGAYVSEEVAALADRDGALSIGGVTRDVAVLFSDLRGFTMYSAGAAPDALIAELNDYFEAMIDAIRPHGGVIDKFIGDAIMVVFGAPTPSGDEATRAIRTAAAMRAALAAHNARREARGLPPLKQGIGVHFGEAVAGNVGTPDRLQYTVVGDTVNTASRLEGATKDVGVDVLLSGAVVARALAEGCVDAFSPLPPVSLRGKPEPTPVFGLA
jgi:adenylate cyclase